MKIDFIFPLLAFLLYIAIFFPIPVESLAESSHYVRTANYFLKAGTDIQSSMFEKLASYDVLILPMEAAIYNKDFFNYARKNNPTITILAYIPARSINIKDLNDGARIREKLYKGIKPDWYLRDPTGSIITAWPDTLPVNITSEWKEYLPQFVHDSLLSTTMWDGIFYDEVDSGISYMNNGNIDINNDGIRDNKEEIDQLWKSAMTHLLDRTRELLGPQALIVINGSSVASYQSSVNGRMFESFPTPWEGNGNWEDSISSYFKLINSQTFEPLFIINGNTGNTGRKDIYQKVRFGLTSTLLNNGYFAFDFGTQDHGQLWKYDEYDISLGKPATNAYLADHSSSTTIRPGVWRRDFQQGTVVVNSTNTLHEVILDGEFEKIRGTQDPFTNDGTILSSVLLAPSDGIILLRPLSTILNAPYQNGSFARIFDSTGKTKRNGFFAYDQNSRGSITIVESTFSPILKRVTAEKGLIRIRDTNDHENEFRPFNAWNGELNIAIDYSDQRFPRFFVSKEYGDNDEISPKKSSGASSTISVFDHFGKLLYSISPAGKLYNGSLRFALGDLNADGSKELVVSTGPNTQPFVRIFDLHGKLLSGGFLAYQKTFRGGVFVAIADIDGNRKGKIITSPGSSGSPLIRVFDNKAHALSPGFLAFSSSNKGGVRILGVDIDNDGKDEIIATTNKVFTYASN